MPLFFPDECLPGDPAGWGRWLMGHYLEHRQFIASAGAAANPTTVTDWPFLQWSISSKSAQAQWLNAHQQVHLQIRAQANVTGDDLSEVDFDDPDQFSEWLDTHSTEHEELRAFYGLT